MKTVTFVLSLKVGCLNFASSCTLLSCQKLTLNVWTEKNDHKVLGITDYHRLMRMLVLSTLVKIKLHFTLVFLRSVVILQSNLTEVILLLLI